MFFAGGTGVNEAVKVIAKHTLNSIRKNPLQSFVIVFSIMLVTACMLFAFSVRTMFYDISSLWAESRFNGGDMRVELTEQNDCAELFAYLDGSEYVRDYFAYGYIGGSAVKTEDVTLAVECAFTDDAEALNRLSGSEVLRTAEPREGELSGAVSHKFAETAGADAGDTVKLCVEGTPLDYEGTGYVTVRITSVFNSTGFYYTNGGSEKIVIDYSELKGKVATRRFGNFLIYLREPDADVEVSAVEKAVRELTGNKLTVYIADGYAENAIEDSVSGSMETLSIGVAAVTMLMAVMIYFSYSVIARNRTEELVKFKASGATPAQSIAIMYAEVCVYVFTGGAAGLAAGTGVLKLAENILRAQVAGITVYAEAWKYALAFAVAAVAAFAACAPPAARMGYMSITALRSESVRFARRAPAWLAIASTVLFAGALTGLFFAEGDALMPMMIVFLVSTVIWAVATVPHVLSAAGALCERIFPKREANIAAMEMPVNAGVTTVAVMLSLVIAFVWTGYCIVDLVRMTSVPADARFTSDFVVPSYAVDVEAQNGILADYLAVDGITDGSYAEKIALYNILRDDGSSYEYEGAIQLLMVPSSEAFPYVCPEVDPEAAEKFETVTRPIILHYSAMEEGGFEIGDKVRLEVWSPAGHCFLEGEFEVAGADYTFTCYDNIAFIRASDCVNEAGERILGNIFYYLNGDKDAFPEIRDAIDKNNVTIFEREYYYAQNSFNAVLFDMLGAFVAVIFAVAALGMIDLVAVTAAERKREFAVYRLSGMTAGGAFRLALTEAAVISVTGFVAGFLFSLGINQTVPALALIVGRYVPRTLFETEIAYIALSGGGIVFLCWLAFTSFTALVARKSDRFNAGSGLTIE